METVILIIFGAITGAIFMWLLMRGKLSVAHTMLEERTKAQEEHHREAIATLEEHHREAMSAQEEHNREAMDMKDKMHDEAIAALEEHHQQAITALERRHQEAFAAQQLRFDETIARIAAQMKDSTNEMLRQRQQEFQESSAGSIGQIVQPLRETLEQMRTTMNETQNRQSADNGAIKTIIQQMMQANEATRKSTDELTRVFRHSNTVQGEWGETVLDELLQSQGLTRGIHYDTQATIRDGAGIAVLSSEGARLRPDVILHLDQRREVIIDSKVSLAAYMDYVNAETEADRQRALKAHITSLQEQVNRLATKDYSSYIQPPKVRMDYVIMFVPNSGALWTALQEQPDLWRRAMERGVYIADEQTLFAALRIINLTWTQIAQAQNHEKVYGLANEMLDRVGQFLKKYQAIGQALNKAQQAYDDGERKLQPSGQSILQTCAKLQKLGAKGSDKNPLPSFTDIDEIPALPPHASEEATTITDEQTILTLDPQ